MSEVQCPVCDFTLQLEPEDGPATLLSAMGVVEHGITADRAAEVEKLLYEHLEEHTSLEWVTAMRMADLYIAKVEGDCQHLASHVNHLKDQLQQAEASLVELRRTRVQVQQAPRPVVDAGFGPVPDDFGAQWEQMSGPERQEMLARDRKAGIVRPIPDSLIPFINPASRPEGVVGRRR